ncbi:hypothetical protein T07_12806 [Trichinella nelsoni]|uniref:Uncharacterized protein n=1 Tax=Trichinella nelsoni TaxID=6336 RepID=A0A0V0RBU6_9BILA|nr:hypothetical protein T07_12806 [Trichinella nelsoni]
MDAPITRWKKRRSPLEVAARYTGRRTLEGNALNMGWWIAGQIFTV